MPNRPIADNTPVVSSATRKLDVDTGASNAVTAAAAAPATALDAGIFSDCRLPNNSVYAITHVASDASARALHARVKTDVAWARRSFSRPRCSDSGSCLA